MRIQAIGHCKSEVDTLFRADAAEPEQVRFGDSRKIVRGSDAIGYYGKLLRVGRGFRLALRDTVESQAARHAGVENSRWIPVNRQM